MQILAVFASRELDHSVCLLRGPTGFTVEYGAEIVHGLTWEKASARLGRCIMHSLECRGTLDKTSGIGDGLIPEVLEAIKNGLVNSRVIDTSFYIEKDLKRKPVSKSMQRRLLAQLTTVPVKK